MAGLVRIHLLIHRIEDLMMFAERLPLSDEEDMRLAVAPCPEAVEEILTDLRSLDSACDQLDLPMTRLAVKREIERFEDQNRGHGRFSSIRYLNGMLATLRDELSTRVFLYLPRKSQGLWEDQAPFGRTVKTVFSQCTTDIEEAARCLALERATASVFHIMRVFEIGMRALIHTFDDGDNWLEIEASKEHGWFDLTRRVFQEASNKTVNARWSDKKDRLHAHASHVRNIKDAWRNQTFHLERHYNLEEAQRIFDTSRIFMQHLAADIQGVSDGEEAKDSDNAAGRRDSDSEAEGRDARLGEGRQTEGAAKVSG